MEWYLSIDTMLSLDELMDTKNDTGCQWNLKWVSMDTILSLMDTQLTQVQLSGDWMDKMVDTIHDI